MIFYDTETCGLHGMPVLIQFAKDDGEVELFSPWTNPIRDTLNLIEWMMNHEGGVVGFNLAFDHFHLCKIYTAFSLYHDHDEIPENIINELAELEPLARDGKCLKPVAACDLMLHARKGPYQSTMDRGDIRIKRVPTALAWQLAAELEEKIKFKDIYFARRKDKFAKRWNVYDIEDSEGEINPDFKDIVIKFAPSSALKALAVDLQLDDDILIFSDVGVDAEWLPEEHGFAPFAKAIGTRFDWKKTWPEVIQHHIDHWNYHELARKYARKDVIYTRGIYEKFGRPELGDDDSELACCIAAVRWHGYKIDVPKLRALRDETISKAAKIPTAPGPVKYYISECLDATERLVLKGTKKVILEELATWTQPCPDCNADATPELIEEKVEAEIAEEYDAPAVILKTKIKAPGTECAKCKGLGEIPHPVATRAREVLDARQATKQREIFDKLLLAGRFHASFKVIGTLSSRMSGTDGLNPQGINKKKEVRSCFPLAMDDFILCGGDFAGFEVTLAEACYKDPKLRKDLLTCEACGGEMRRVNEVVAATDFLGDNYSKYLAWKKEPANTFENDFICIDCGSNKGKKIHALFGVHVCPDMTYEQIKATEGTANDWYTKCKQAVFAMFYGGEGSTLQDRLGVDLETANKAYQRFTREYKQVGVERQKIFEMFCSMRQPKGIGSRVEWHEPQDYIESMFGFRRYFTLENQICKTLFTLANTPPKAWKDINIRVQRRDRQQSATGAVQSALFAAAFAVQAGNMRAAANHVIQSSGATITKRVQRAIWDVQPIGIHEWQVVPMNIHDEIMAPCRREIALKVKNVVNATVESFRPQVPLIKMDWVIGLPTWAEKG